MNRYTIIGIVVAVIGILSLDWIPNFWYLGVMALGSGSILLVISMFTMAELTQIKEDT